MQLDGSVKMELDELLIKPLCLACDNIDLLKSDRETGAFICECAYACQGWVYRLQRQLRKCDIHEHSYAVYVDQTGTSAGHQQCSSIFAVTQKCCSMASTSPRC